MDMVRRVLTSITLTIPAYLRTAATTSHDTPFLLKHTLLSISNSVLPINISQCKGVFLKWQPIRNSSES